MTKIKNICQFLNSFAPIRLAEDWDNVGLLVGDSNRPAKKVMTCLTVTAESSAEAIKNGADLIVSHHPLPFRPLKRITTDHVASKLLWELIRAGVSIYSPHTGFDSAKEGINQSLAQRISLTNIEPLVPLADDPDCLGAGRIGNFLKPTNKTNPPNATLGDLITTIKQEFKIAGLHVVGPVDQPVSKVAIACGSGGSFLEKAACAGCDTFVTGETTFHTCLEAKARNISLVLLGHYASERFAVEDLAQTMASTFPDSEIWASQNESDPIDWV